MARWETCPRARPVVHSKSSGARNCVSQREDGGERVLGDEHGVAVEPVGEVSERLVGLLAQLVDERLLEHHRVAAATEDGERGFLDRREPVGRRRVVAHGAEVTDRV